MSDATETTRPRAFDPRMASSRRAPTEPPGWDLATERRIDDGETLATAIAWFSLGLGIAELIAPERIARFLGMEGRTELIRAYGVREVAKGVGILNQRQPEGWMWARVAGDVLDLATLATGLESANRHRNRVGIAMAAVAGVAVLDVLCARRLRSVNQRPIRPSRDIRPPLGNGSGR